MVKQKKYKRIFCLILIFALIGTMLPHVAAEEKNSGHCGVKIEIVNSWQNDTEFFVQYAVKLQSGNEQISGWRLQIDFDCDIALSGSWNGRYTISEKVLTVQPESYNEQITAGGSEALGFIVKGRNAPRWQAATLIVDANGSETTFTIKQGGSMEAPEDQITTPPTVEPPASTVPSEGENEISSGKTPVAKCGQLQVKGTKLTGKGGKEIALKGVSTHGINWYPEYVNKTAFKTLRDQWGVNCIRLAMYTEEYNGYCSGGSKKELRKLVNRGVKDATDLGMYVVIDWHILSDGNPKRHQKQAVAFFREMAKKYKNQKNVIYEICNEPNGGTQWKDVKSYAKQVIKAIRTYDKKNLILVGTPTWSQDVDTAARSPIKGYSNVMYTFHFYAATHGKAYRDKVQQALDAGLPVFVSEFSICESSGSGRIDKTEANRWMKFLKKNKISYVCWNLSNKKESSSLLKSSCKKTGKFKNADLSVTGKWYRDV